MKNNLLNKKSIAIRYEAGGIFLFGPDFTNSIHSQPYKKMSNQCILIKFHLYNCLDGAAFQYLRCNNLKIIIKTVVMQQSVKFVVQFFVLYKLYKFIHNFIQKVKYAVQQTLVMLEFQLNIWIHHIQCLHQEFELTGS